MVNIAVFSILADRSKNNLQSAQLLIGRELVSGPMMAAVHLFSTVVLARRVDDAARRLISWLIVQ